MKHVRLALTLAGAVVATTPGTITPGMADDWPSRPVRMVNTFAAGGTAEC